MNRFCLILTLFFSSLSCETLDELASSSLASTQGLMSSIVGGCVSSISGELVLHETDLVLPGPAPLKLQRTYSSADPTKGFILKAGWYLAEPTLFRLTKEKRSIEDEKIKVGSAIVTTSQGARVKFEINHTKKFEKKTVFKFASEKGFTNCGANLISANTNIRNNVLSIINMGSEFDSSGELIASNGAVQHYIGGIGAPSYLLSRESSTDRTKKHFTYKKGNIDKIVQHNTSETIAYGWFNFNPSRHTVESSPGKKVIYDYVKKDSYFLKQVESDEKPTVTYAHTKSSLYPNHYIISEKKLPEGRGLKFSYFEKRNIKDRVKEIQAPSGEDAK